MRQFGIAIALTAAGLACAGCATSQDDDFAMNGQGSYSSRIIIADEQDQDSEETVIGAGDSLGRAIHAQSVAMANAHPAEHRQVANGSGSSQIAE